MKVAVQALIHHQNRFSQSKLLERPRKHAGFHFLQRQPVDHGKLLILKLGCQRRPERSTLHFDRKLR
jgi:hypothetical protein